MPTATDRKSAEDEAAAFYLYVKARMGERDSLSVREAAQVYKEYLADRDEAEIAVAPVRYMSTSEAAKRMGVSPQTIRNWIKEGVIQGVRIGNRKGDLRIPEDFLHHMNLGFAGNPEFADPVAYIDRLRDSHEKLSDAEYLAMIDAEANTDS